MATKPKVEQRAYHGEIDPEELAQALVMRFDSGETHAHWMRQGRRAVVQVRNRRVESGDPNTAVTIQISSSQTGIVVTVSEQKILGVAADMARTGMKAWLNPMRLLGELDDIARNVRLLGLRGEVWQAIDEYVRGQGSTQGAGGILSNVVCSYCGTPNEVGAANCQACRAPLAEVQPVICGRCGFLNRAEASLCGNCGARL